MKAGFRAVGALAGALVAGGLLAPGAAAAAGTAAPTAPTVAYLRTGDVYVAAGTAVHRLTTDGHNARPRWSPDGRRIAYLHVGGLWVMNGDGSGKQQVARHATGAPSWSPDSAWLAYVVGCDGIPTVFKVSAGAATTPPGSPVPLLPGTSACTPGGMSYPRQPATLAGKLRYDDAVAWSPDGRRLAFRGGDCQGVYDDCLTVADIGTGGQAAVDAYGGGGEIYSGFAVVPAWRPDGARLAWTAWRDGDEHTAAQPVHVNESDPAGAGRHQVGARDDRELAYYDTTRALLTATRNGASWLVLMNLTTGGRTYLRPGSQPSPRPGSLA